jgi:hypothetical protein
MANSKIVGSHADSEVFVDGVQLDLQKSLEVVNKSPTGFAWGYSGSGPGQLALAILLQFTDDDTARSLFQRFKDEYIAPLPFGQDFVLEVDVHLWIQTHKTI